MTKTFQVTVVSADRQIFTGEVDGVVATATTGEIGILAGHEPALMLLKAGQVRLTTGKDEAVIYVSGGFLEVQPNHVLVLADAAERAEALDEVQIQKVRDEAKAVMANKQVSKVDLDKAETLLLQATAQLTAVRRKKSGH